MYGNRVHQTYQVTKMHFYLIVGYFNEICNISGFLEGWAVSQRCLKRQFTTPGTNDFIPVMFGTLKDLVAALLEKKV